MGFARDDGFGNPINMERYGVGSPQWQIQTPFGFRQYGGPDVPHDQFGDFSSLGQNLGAMTALSNPYMKGDGTGRSRPVDARHARPEQQRDGPGDELRS